MENETATQRGSGAQIVVLVPAHQEAASIASVLGAVLAQERPADRVVVAANGCTDETAEVARSFGSSVTVIDLPRLQHRKSEALNLAWSEYADDADLVVCLDGDTVLPPNALGDWEKEFSARERLGGSSAKFTIQAGGFLPRMQKAEYSVGIDNALRRGSTTVLPGAGVMFRGSVLRTIADRPDREGPWSYESATEDFELTYRIREAGWHCGVSGDVRAYTDSMRTVRALWGQRLKWQGGTLEDLFRFGLNRLTLRDWVAQGAGMLNVVTRLLWLTMISLALVLCV
jgi:cellulose synthase/poly-beta-1,6-N-acetylglucosamine synthase-like glycosyltransferase